MYYNRKEKEEFLEGRSDRRQRQQLVQQLCWKAISIILKIKTK